MKNLDQKQFNTGLTDARTRLNELFVQLNDINLTDLQNIYLDMDNSYHTGVAEYIGQLLCVRKGRASCGNG